MEVRVLLGVFAKMQISFLYSHKIRMDMIENGKAKCRKENEYGFYTVGKVYEIVDGFITDDTGDGYTNFGNVRKFFSKVK